MKFFCRRHRAAEHQKLPANDTALSLAAWGGGGTWKQCGYLVLAASILAPSPPQGGQAPDVIHRE